jgi:membrane-bound ClpP family serine protease
MGKKLNPVAGAGAILLLIGVVVWLFVSMAIGMVIGVIGLVLVIVGTILSTTTGARKQPTMQPPVAQPPVVSAASGTTPNPVTTPSAGQAKFCTGCGTQIALETSFCGKCGKKNPA